MAKNTSIPQKKIPTIIFNPKTAPQLEEPTLNGYGLDLTSIDFIKYKNGNLEAEVIGGITALVLTRFTIMLKISRRPQQSAQDVYRNTLDLYNENNLQHFIKQTAIKLKVETPTIADFIYDLTERLESYRKDKLTYKEDNNPVSPPLVKEQQAVKKLLHSPTLMTELESLLLQTGTPCLRAALQLFLISLSSKLPDVMHCVLQGSTEFTATIIKQFAKVLPDEVSRYKTSLSDNVLYYAPSESYWKHKVLLLPSLDTLGKKNMALTELLIQGKVSRMVTENTEQGSYRASHKSISGELSFISSTAKGYHELLHSDTVLALPLQNILAIKEAITVREIKYHAGLINEDSENKSARLVQFIFRELKAVKVINPYLDELDITTFLNKDYRLISQFLRLTQLVALLHQKQLGATKSEGINQIEVQPKHMLVVLELFQEIWVKEEKELSFTVAGTLATVKDRLKKNNPDNYTETDFLVKDMRAKLKVSPSSFARHINTLYDYGRLDRTGGNKRDGYTYKVTNWEDTNMALQKYEQFKTAINSL